MADDSASIKRAVIQQIQTEAQVANARTLIEKLQGSCFTSCVPTPGSSLSSGESACMTNCMEKYMASWNIINATYISRIKQEQASGSLRG
ncbi:Mitochondrial import inner membrane translocase subunit TIM13 [Ceratocystis fimbriata CBS 114723]|uniref:Mitochondrial import inner membrane translocase subunit n=1 Tax=Ceratocystis fimbriata CBS 114723 TaxID=1035309 RepID=A0A2C5XDB7_9PEZI|nr:Mitochondrial import inner membrane translocase subunit TIM13 [Ceratocystis fimbriata CBS 114723]